MIVYCISGDSKYPILAFFVEKPPVANVVIAWFTASKIFIPSAHKMKKRITVKDIYINHNL
jgi:hypothetical protein